MTPLQIRNVIKDEIELSEYSEFYFHNFYCVNCWTKNHKYIKKGVRAKEIKFKCSRCGCMIHG